MISPDDARRAVHDLLPDDEVLGAFLAFRGAPPGLEVASVVPLVATLAFGIGVWVSIVFCIVVLMAIRWSRVWVTIAHTSSGVILVESPNGRAPTEDDEMALFDKQSVRLHHRPGSMRVRLEASGFDLSMWVLGRHQHAAAQVVDAL